MRQISDERVNTALNCYFPQVLGFIGSAPRVQAPLWTVTSVKMGNGSLKLIHSNICAVESVVGCYFYISLRILASGAYNQPQDSLNKTK
jgi:hypothetical protein